jgi:hypothetical protein
MRCKSLAHSTFKNSARLLPLPKTASLTPPVSSMRTNATSWKFNNSKGKTTFSARNLEKQTKRRD